MRWQQGWAGNGDGSIILPDVRAGAWGARENNCVRRPDLQLRAERVTDEQELAKQQARTTGNKKGRLLPQLAAYCQSMYPQATFASLTTLGACATIQYRAKRVLVLAAEGD